MINGNVRVNLVDTKENPSDFFTKALPRDSYIQFRAIIMDGQDFDPSPVGPALTRK